MSMKVIGIDLENYYDKIVSIKPLGIDGYLNHPEAELYLLSLYSENEEGEATLEWSGPIDENTPWEEVKGCHAIAHNARFDETDWIVNTLKGIIPADCQPAKWSCTADLSVYLSGPRSLMGATRQLLNVVISKAYRGTALSKSWKDFNDEEKVEICTAGLDDACYSFLLWKHFHEQWPEDEQKLSRINRKMGRRGIAINEKMLDEAINKMNHLLWEAGNQIPWEWGGKRSKTPMLAKEIAIECRKVGIPCPTSFAQDAPDAMEWEETYGEKYPWIKALKVWRSGAGFLTKLQNIAERTVDGIYPFCLKYYGAHTGRMSGDGGFNMLNIYKDERFGTMLRNVFIPRPGKKFLIVDYCQVEARILAWVCKMEGTLKLIREGISIYEVHAIETMGYKHDPEVPLKKKDPDLYSLAKARVLALGYGCGAEKFQVMAWSLCRLRLELPDCKKTVYAFRGTNREIVQHWDHLHAEMASATRKKNRGYRLTLPSGRYLDYFDVNMGDGMKAKVERGGTAFHYYGGKLCENEIQAIGRDVLKDARIACDEQVPEYPMVLDVYDEIVFEVPENITEDEIKRVCSLMTDSSPWAKGLPLDVEWSLTEMYEK
jgi:hypothetical protein